MKNKFMMVGLAYTFRRGMDNGGHPELSIEAFQDAINQVGMKYSANDVRRVFNAFDSTSGGMSGAPTLQVVKLTSHLSSAPRPQQPALYGSAQFSESPLQLRNDMNSLAAQSFPSGMQVHQGMSGRHPDPPAAPPEGVTRELWKRSSDTEWLGEADATNPNEPPP